MAALTSPTSSSLLSQAVAIQEHPTSSGGEETAQTVPKTLVPSPSHVQGTFFTREPELSAAPLCYQTCP